MAPRSTSAEMADSVPARAGEYVVVARRYRPQAFEELLGQEHVARALSNAISTQRVGHAYLFTGARGVGKTSAARILAKALNCEKGPTSVPCNQCDICRAISSGDDVDVLEIDGASNRGIDEIRQLRQNVNVRPSRERFKIYIIDEVHMLTREAFNALLKTLEEPPEHVKFIFCTTEPGKIPITILSRCQRFDFAGIRAVSIADRLQQIVQAEGVAAEREALELIARRANGSMRDSQSLLEQLLAFAPERITVADVNGMLGTAGEERLVNLVSRLVARDAAAALAELDQAMQQGVEVAQLLEQLFGYFRDCMVAAVGAPAEMFLNTSPANRQVVMDAGKRLGLETVLAGMQILEQTLSRLRYSTQGRILAELAIVRISSLEDLAELGTWIVQLQRGERVAPGAVMGAIGSAVSSPADSAAVKKKYPVDEPTPVARPVTAASGGIASASPSGSMGGGTQEGTRQPPVPRGKTTALSAESASEIWTRAIAKVAGFAAEHAKYFAQVATPAPNRLVVSFKAGYTLQRSMCDRPDQKAKFEQALTELTGQRIVLEFCLLEEQPAAKAEAAARTVTPHQRMVQVAQNPLVRRAVELFRAHPGRVEDPADGKTE